MPKRNKKSAATKEEKRDDTGENAAESTHLSPFEKLPLHIIEKIISMLDAKDIKKKMMFVNKNINRIISNSPMLMKNFTLPIRIEHFILGRYDDFYGVRRYEAVEIRGGHLSNTKMKAFKNFLKPYADYIKFIKFDRYNTWFHQKTLDIHMVDKQIIKEVLKLCKKVQFVRICGFPDEKEGNLIEEDQKWINVQPLQLPDLKGLEFPRNGKGMINFFKNCQLRTFYLSPDGSNNYSSQHVKNFLLDQRELVSLQLNSAPKLFDDDSFTKMSFKLKSLVVENRRLGCTFEANECFKSFINAHATTLTVLDTPGCFMNNFSHFRHIQKLNVNFSYCKNYQFNSVMETVEQITFSNLEFEQLAKSFPNLKVINLEWCTFKGDFLKDLPFAVRLNFSGLEGDAISLMNVKYIDMYKCNFTFKEVVNNQLTKLKMLHYEAYADTTYGWLKELLESDKTKLELLDFNPPNDDLYDIIEKNKHKVDRLILPFRVKKNS